MNSVVWLTAIFKDLLIKEGRKPYYMVDDNKRSPVTPVHAYFAYSS